MIGQFFEVHSPSRRRVDALVRVVAEQCTAAVTAASAGRLAGMSVCESRGYIRARASVLVRRQVRAVVQRESKQVAAQEAALAARSIERVVALVMRQLASRAWRAPLAGAAEPSLRRAA